MANYLCDFGNIVVTNSKKKPFIITNVGKLPVSFQFDKKFLSSFGMVIEPDKVNKMLPGEWKEFNAELKTRRVRDAERKLDKTLDIFVKNGPRYTIQFIANLAVPELKMSHDSLEFGKVIVGQRKTFQIRFENDKEVTCDWSYSYRKVNSF